MFTGLSGLNSNQFRIDTVGDNIANVNTTAFKSNRATFENQFAITLSGGTAPGPTTGGTNPSQMGRGSMLGGVQRNFSPGSLETTGVPTDMAIEGQGFFIVNATGDQQAYTRDGTFKLNADNMLVSSNGYQLRGYGVDSNFSIVPGALTDISIPLGTLSSALATSTAGFDGNLNANGTAATQGTILYSQALEQGPGSPATGATLLTNLFDPATPANALFAENDVITVDGQKGGRDLPAKTFTVTATSTLDDFLTFMNDSLGINQDATLPNTPGLRVSDTDPPTPGTIIIEGNSGEQNALALGLTDIRSTNANFANPFSFTQQQAANGDSVYTTFQGFDSLGTPVQVNLTMVLDSKSSTGNTWRFYAESPNDTDATPVLGATGTLTFDNNGRLTASTGNVLQINRAATGATDPLEINLDFSKVTGLTTQDSALVMTTQDGFPTGTLTNFSVGIDGVINGTFSNGLNQTLGQVALATFTNPEGLVGGPNNLFFVGANSGQPIIATASTLGAGRIIGGALELSNVDLTREFIGLISASTGFSASGRVISTSNDLLNELLQLAR